MLVRDSAEQCVEADVPSINMIINLSPLKLYYFRTDETAVNSATFVDECATFNLQEINQCGQSDNN